MIRSGVVNLVGMGLLGACTASPSGTPSVAQVALRVTNGDSAFAQSDGAAARKRAAAQCAARGQQLQTSIYDRYEAGAWVFVEGCR